MLRRVGGGEKEDCDGGAGVRGWWLGVALRRLGGHFVYNFDRVLWNVLRFSIAM